MKCISCITEPKYARGMLLPDGVLLRGAYMEPREGIDRPFRCRDLLYEWTLSEKMCRVMRRGSQNEEDDREETDEAKDRPVL